MKIVLLTIVMAYLAIDTVSAADIAEDVRRSADRPDTSNGGYFELGIGIGYIDNPLLFAADEFDEFILTPVIAGSYRYNGFFVELSQGTQDGLGLGVNVYSGDRWAFDFLVSSISGNLNTKDGNDDFSLLTETERDAAFLDRDTFYNGAGIRLTGYLGDAIVQYRLITDIHDNNGLSSALRVGYSWQRRNWNFHSVISADYGSKKSSQYIFGIDAEDATAMFPQYTPGVAHAFTGEIGATYPVSEHLVFRSTALYTRFSKEIVNSPLVDGNGLAYVSTSISYVF